MGIKCPDCGSTNTESSEPGKMWCKNCGKEWKPYKHRGKKMRYEGEGIVYPRRKIMPGSKTKIVGSKILGNERRVKKVKQKEFNVFDF